MVSTFGVSTVLPPSKNHKVMNYVHANVSMATEKSVVTGY